MGTKLNWAGLFLVTVGPSLGLPWYFGAIVFAVGIVLMFLDK